MILSFNYQTGIFLTAVILGLAFGLGYDLVRIFRMIIRHNKFFLQTEDFVFWLGAAAITFWVMFENNDGEVRPFVLIGVGLGMVVYFCALSLWVWGGTKKIIDIFKGILRVFLRPMVKFLRFMIKPAEILINFLAVKCKKLLQLWKLYVKLNMKKLRYQFRTIFKK